MPLSAQSPTCGPDGVIDTSSFSGTAFFNYGSSARLTNQNYRSASAVGQTFVGYIDGLIPYKLGIQTMYSQYGNTCVLISVLLVFISQILIKIILNFSGLLQLR